MSVTLHSIEGYSPIGTYDGDLQISTNAEAYSITGTFWDAIEGGTPQPFTSIKIFKTQVAWDEAVSDQRDLPTQSDNQATLQSTLEKVQKAITKGKCHPRVYGNDLSINISRV